MSARNSCRVGLSAGRCCEREGLWRHMTQNIRFCKGYRYEIPWPCCQGQLSLARQQEDGKMHYWLTAMSMACFAYEAHLNHALHKVGRFTTLINSHARRSVTVVSHLGFILQVVYLRRNRLTIDWLSKLRPLCKVGSKRPISFFGRSELGLVVVT